MPKDDSVPLREYFQRQLEDLRRMLDERHVTQSQAVDKAFAAQQLAVDRALLAAEKAVIKAETAADKRFEAGNETRAQIADQQATFITKVEAVAAIDRNSERITELTDRINRSEGKGAGLNSGWVLLLGAVGLVFGLISTFVAIYLALKGH